MAVEISGTEIILSDLEKMIPTDANMDEALTAGADIITEEMRRIAPVRSGSGKLKGAINTGPPKNGKRGRVVTSGVHRSDWGSDEYYPPYVEYGHGGPHPAAPHPFIRPAYDLKKDAAWNAVKQAAINQLKKKGL